MDNSYIYTGNPIIPNFDFNMGGEPLKLGIDYDIEIEDNINVGTAKIHITGKGKFTGTVEQTFEIKPVPAKNLKFYADSTVFDYTGEPIEMQLVVKYGEEMELVEGRDYTISYTDNIEIGRAAAQMTFKGNFEGIMNIPFLIKTPLVNTSKAESETVEFGKSVKIISSAEGGKYPYKYSYYCRRSDVSKWLRLSDYTEESEYIFAPNFIKDYIILVRIKDADGRIADKQIPISVASVIEGECKIEKQKVAVNENISIAVNISGGEAPFKFRYLVNRREINKWIPLKRDESLSKIEFSPKHEGIYDICVKVEDSKGHHAKFYNEISAE